MRSALTMGAEDVVAVCPNAAPAMTRSIVTSRNPHRRIKLPVFPEAEVVSQLYADMASRTQSILFIGTIMDCYRAQKDRARAA
jgi:hypothetical protein